MTLETNLSTLTTRVATELKAHKVLINNNAADLSALTTTNKANLVAAINELVTAIGGAGATIDDGAISTLTVWSSDKTDGEIDSRVATAVADLIDASPATLNTLNELAAALGDDPNFATTVAGNIAAKVTGPASAVNNNLVVFDGTTGKLAADSGVALTSVVRTADDQTIAGVKTFSSSPVVPDASFVIAKITGLQTALDGKSATGHTHTASNITDFSSAVPAAVPSASESVSGKVELSTNAEAIAGTDTARAVTPANLAAYVGDPNEDFVATFEAGLV